MSPALSDLIERTLREVWVAARLPENARHGDGSPVSLRWAQFGRGKIQRAVDEEIERRVSEAGTGEAEATDG